MKKTLILTLALLAVLALAITVPGASAEGPETIADVYAIEGAVIEQTATYENCFVCAGWIGETPFRAEAGSTPEILSAISDLDFFSPDYEKLYLELVGPLKVTSFEDLTGKIPPQEQLDQLVGKTGAELFEDGWMYSMFDFDTLEATLDHGDFSYDVTFEGTPAGTVDDDVYEAMAPLTVKTISWKGIGDGATDIDPFSFGPMIDCTGSELFSEEELDEAVGLILAEFDGWPEGCELHYLVYAGDEACTPENLTWLSSLNSGDRRYAECAEFLSEFRSPEDPESAGAFEPDMIYSDWQWWLAREEGGDWELLTWGY